ncbi:MAG TPA: metal-sensitive transcriptional regulator [Acidimicrobiia bacterium]|nr:metal-sensitive transcriptional regulator [Acidimicrobiia bacterium]
MSDDATRAPGYHDQQEAVQRRLRRIEGQVRGLQRMVGDDAYCIDVLTQISAVTRALQGVALELLEDHLDHCVRDAMSAGGPDADAKIAEATAAIARLVKS